MQSSPAGISETSTGRKAPQVGSFDTDKRKTKMPPLHKDRTTKMNSNNNKIGKTSNYRQHSRSDGNNKEESISSSSNQRHENSAASSSTTHPTPPTALFNPAASSLSSKYPSSNTSMNLQNNDNAGGISSPTTTTTSSANTNPTFSRSSSSSSSSSSTPTITPIVNKNAADKLWLARFPLISRYIRNWNETTVSGWHMTRLWVFGMMTPLSVLTWTLTHRISAVIASVLMLPTIAIMQGSLAIMKYRIKYGESPLPKAPSHGIIKCITKSNAEIVYNNQHVGSSDSGYHQYGSATTTAMSESLLFGDSTTTFEGFVDSEHHSASSNSTPLRLLVIGDSLAIGVGQSESATPIMPETIAKSLSKAMNGRPVLWTCHGAPGASAGWIVRELERSIKHGQFMQTNPPSSSQRFYKDIGKNANRNSCCDTTQTIENTAGKSDSFMDSESCSSSSVDSFLSDNKIESTSNTFVSPDTDNHDDHAEDLKTWSDRLKEHKIRFDPNVLGPFDIAIVLTGSNDLKSAFFPFLLTGEDAEFRRQAQQRGGGYGKELTRLLQVLNSRMRMRLQTLRETVEAATERVRESVDHIRERLNSHDMNTSSSELHGSSRSQNSAPHRMHTVKIRNGNDPEKVSADLPHYKETTSLLDSNGMSDGTSRHTVTSLHSPLFPMVVLPGMPARALPIFQTAPLRWLAVPIVDIMDSHKKNLAKQHDGEVLFIDAPCAKDIAAYACQMGRCWDEEQDDRVLLNLRGIKRKQARQIESDMKDYFSKKDQPKKPETLPIRRRHHSMFSVDGIHPNDKGYDFWGRYIAQGIVEEWKRKQLRMQNNSDLV